MNHLNKQGLMKNFICGDFNFCQDESMNGFVIFPNASPAFYKEDLNGWGYDDIQFYKDLENKAHLHKNSFFNIESYITHLCHKTTKNATLEKTNKELCKVKNRNQIRRNYSNSPEGIIYDNSNPIERIFCINLDHRIDRWNHIKNFHYKNLIIERLPAIKSQSSEPHLKYNPINLDSELYFHAHPNGFGTYLSHYKIWQKIVEQKISHALIIEDDINIKSLYNLFYSNMIFDESIHLYNLSKRVREIENDFVVFDGAESYILTYKGAELLLEITRRPLLLNEVNIPIYNSNVAKLASNHNIKSYEIPDYESSVIAPVDKFIGMCCASSLLQDHYYLYPSIDLNEAVADESDISHKNTESWLLNEEETLELAKKLNAIVSTKTS
jgi:GR25 family glycosyltransferase involved in LPS biosynthesis